jgi:hypothetical protein
MNEFWKGFRFVVNFLLYSLLLKLCPVATVLQVNPFYANNTLIDNESDIAVDSLVRKDEAIGQNNRI